MLVAIVSDIHGNRHALEAVLADVASTDARELWCLGDAYAKRIAEAMLPHLFDDINPPAMHVAALGDLGGAIGAALLAQPASGRPV
jgi:hypothetical protein